MTQLVTLEGDQPDLYGYMENVIDNGDGTMSGDYISPELGRFKFKMPKMPKMRAMKGLSKSVGKAGKSVGKLGKQHFKNLGKVGKGILKSQGKLIKGIGKGLSKLGEGAMDMLNQDQPQPEQEEEQLLEEEEEQFQEDEMQNEEQDFQDQSDVENDQEVGFMSMLSNMASGGGGKGGGILSMATGALDMVVPGAGTVANIGIGAAQKQRQKQKAKKAQRQKQISQFSNRFLDQRNNKKITNRNNTIKQVKQTQPIRQANTKPVSFKVNSPTPQKFSVNPQKQTRFMDDWFKDDKQIEAEKEAKKPFLQTTQGMVIAGVGVASVIYFITKKGKK